MGHNQAYLSVCIHTPTPWQANMPYCRYTYIYTFICIHAHLYVTLQTIKNLKQNSTSENLLQQLSKDNNLFPGEIRIEKLLGARQAPK